MVCLSALKAIRALKKSTNVGVWRRYFDITVSLFGVSFRYYGVSALNNVKYYDS